MVRLFTHNDLDGIGCAILAMKAFEDVDVSYCDYNDIDKKVGEYLASGTKGRMCFITDIRVNDTLAEEIDRHHEDIHLLDHHPTSLKLEKYPWCTVKIEDWKTGIKTSGTELFYQWLIDHDFLVKNETLDKFVKIVRDYDTWRWNTLGEDGIICKQINDLLYIYGRKKFIEWCLSEIDNEIFPELYLLEDTLLESRQREIDNYIEKKDKEIIFSELCGHKCGFLFAERYISELGNKLCQLHPEIDFIVMINIGNRTVSYRTVKTDIDLGRDIASLFGGGGHPKTAGSQFLQNVQLSVINEIFGKRGESDEI